MQIQKEPRPSRADDPDPAGKPARAVPVRGLSQDWGCGGLLGIFAWLLSGSRVVIRVVPLAGICCDG